MPFAGFLVGRKRCASTFVVHALLLGGTLGAGIRLRFGLGFGFRLRLGFRFRFGGHHHLADAVIVKDLGPVQLHDAAAYSHTESPNQVPVNCGLYLILSLSLGVLDQLKAPTDPYKKM